MNQSNPMLNIDTLRAHVRQLTEQRAHIAQLAKQIDDLLESSGKPHAMTQQIIDAEGMRDHFQQRLESVQIKLAQEREKSEGLERDRDAWKAAHDGEIARLQNEINRLMAMLLSEDGVTPCKLMRDHDAAIRRNKELELALGKIPKRAMESAYERARIELNRADAAEQQARVAPGLLP